MMSGEQSSSNARFALNFPRIYICGLDAVAKGYEPLVRGIGRCNLEALAFFSRRWQAWLAFAARLGDCKSPADLATTHMQFWQDATLDYSQSAQRLAGALGGCVALSELKGAGQHRDFITVEEPTTSAGKRSDRKAA